MKKTIIIGSVISLSAIAVFLIWRRTRKVRQIKDQLKYGSPDIVEESKSYQNSVVFPLEKGAGYNDVKEASCVKLIQRYLNMKIIENPSIGHTILEEDGKFGVLTENALRRIAGTTSVSYSLYKSMEMELIPKYLRNDTGSYSEPKPDIFDYLKF